MQVMYIGPNNRKLGLLYGKVYEDGLTWETEQALNDYPELGRLIVPVDEIDEVQAKVMRAGTPEHRAYEVIHEVQ